MLFWSSQLAARWLIDVIFLPLNPEASYSSGESRAPLGYMIKRMLMIL